jgi:transcriptional regulator with GAF, ATPase, and Fis domain
MASLGLERRQFGNQKPNATTLRRLKQTNWVIGGPSGAAARLGMKRTTLISRMQKLGISRPRHITGR